MCFSAEASFVSAALVGACSYFTLREVKRPLQIPLALLPLGFALQQASEGMIWLFKNNQWEQNSLFWASVWTYVTFAFLIWPIWFPLSALLLEKVQWRRRVLGVCLFAGLCVSVSFLLHFLNLGITVDVVGNSLRYDVTDRIFGIPYLAVLSFSFILSSVPRLWVMGVAAPISFFLSAYFYWENFASIWCFFAAFISLWIYVVMRGMA